MTENNKTGGNTQQTSHSEAPGTATSSEENAEPKSRLRSLFRLFVPLLILLLAGIVLFRIAGSWNAWSGEQSDQRTDDAYLRADITPLSTRVSGTVVKVAVEDYQQVKAGDLLVQIKNTDYLAQVKEAEAGIRGAQAALENNRRQKELQDSRIEQAKAGADAARAEIEQAGAGIEAAQADRINAQSGVEGANATISAALAGVEGAKADVLAAQANVEGAQADVQVAQANVEGAQADIEAAQTNIAGAKADVERTRQERSRQEALVSLGSATRQKLEQVVAEDERFQALLSGRQAELLRGKAVLAGRQATLLQVKSLLASRQAALLQVRTLLTSRQATLVQTRAQLEGRQSDVAKARAQLALRQAALRQALAQLAGRTADLDAQYRQRPILDAQRAGLVADLNSRQEALKVAQTNLEYTRILAPEDGVVGERKVRLGQLVSPGTQAISLIENNLWIQANYKETQLTHVRRGDPVEATVDALPGVVLRGHVEEIAPASGSQFALMPPDNATGNYTKIAQRIPVKIALDPNPALAEHLRPGMSVIVEIKTSGRRQNGTSTVGEAGRRRMFPLW
ncbi:MAG: Type secretion system, rane fusion protein LapC [Chthonomonadaceae bacterium]|nr:Type secretion system, rane fusion protein LapC [Chthonomonadaceae bacterium]